jgi:hypothetical protein
MYILHMEHDVPDYQTWKQRGFDADPLGRKAMGVRRYRIGRRSDQPNHVMIELEFDDAETAARMGVALNKMWEGAQARGLIGAPTLSSFEIVEAREV